MASAITIHFRSRCLHFARSAASSVVFSLSSASPTVFSLSQPVVAVVVVAVVVAVVVVVLLAPFCTPFRFSSPPAWRSCVAVSPSWSVDVDADIPSSSSVSFRADGDDSPLRAVVGRRLPAMALIESRRQSSVKITSVTTAVVHTSRDARASPTTHAPCRDPPPSS